MEWDGPRSTKARPNTYSGGTTVRKASISGPTPARPTSMCESTLHSVQMDSRSQYIADLPYHFDGQLSIPTEAWTPSFPTSTTYTPDYVSTDSQGRLVVVDLSRRSSHLVDLDHKFPAGPVDALDVAVQTFFRRSTPEARRGSVWSDDSDDDDEDEPDSYPGSLASDDMDSLLDPDDHFLSQFPRLSTESFPHFDDLSIPPSFYLSNSNDSDVFHECYATDEELEKARSDYSDAHSASSFSSPSSFGGQSFGTDSGTGSSASSVRGVGEEEAGLDLRCIDGLLESEEGKEGRGWRRSL